MFLHSSTSKRCGQYRERLAVELMEAAIEDGRRAARPSAIRKPVGLRCFVPEKPAVAGGLLGCPVSQSLVNFGLDLRRFQVAFFQGFPCPNRNSHGKGRLPLEPCRRPVMDPFLGSLLVQLNLLIRHHRRAILRNSLAPFLVGILLKRLDPRSQALRPLPKTTLNLAMRPPLMARSRLRLMASRITLHPVILNRATDKRLRGPINNRATRNLPISNRGSPHLMLSSRVTRSRCLRLLSTHRKFRSILRSRSRTLNRSSTGSSLSKLTLSLAIHRLPTRSQGGLGRFPCRFHSLFLFGLSLSRLPSNQLPCGPWSLSRLRPPRHDRPLWRRRRPLVPRP